MTINVPKSMLPDCAVGETVEMTITGEEGDSFMLSPYEKEEAAPAAKSAPAKKAAKSKRPRAVDKALSKMSSTKE